MPNSGSAQFFNHRILISPTTSRDYYSFPGPSKVRFSGFKVVVQENSKGKFIRKKQVAWMRELSLVLDDGMGVVCKNTYTLTSRKVAFSKLNKRVKQ